MAGFIAEAVVEPLDYDFGLYIPGCKGVIPEPSVKQLDDFTSNYAELFSNLRKTEESRRSLQDEVIKALAGDEVLPTSAEVLEKWRAEKGTFGELARTIDAELVGLVAEVCSQTPSEDQIKQLPHRIRQAFTQWIVREMLDPKFDMPEPSFTKPSPVAAIGA